MATIQEIIAQWQKALRIEMKYLKTKGGARFIITDGKCLRRHEEGATYWFMLTSDALLPDDTPIRLEYKEWTVHGKVVSVEGFDVILDVNMYVGEHITEAYLYSEPWELLEALATRLDEVSANANKQKRVLRLLAANAPVKHPKEKIKSTVHEVTLRAKYNATTYVWGPPGTGKTYTLARMIGRHYLAGKKVLVLAHSNAAVDVLLLEIAKYIQEKNAWKSGDILRYGFSADPRVREYDDLLAEKWVARNHPGWQAEMEQLESERARLKKRYALQANHKEALAEVEKRLNALRRKGKAAEASDVGAASVLGVTLSKAAMDPLIYEREFDLIVVDEASMAYIPQVAFASSLGRKIVVCGDFKQLPPIALAEAKLVDRWLRRDIFHGAKIVEAIQQGKAHPHLVMLKEQRRMHPEISSFTNQYIYDNQVSDHASVKKERQPLANHHPFPKEAATLIDISQMGAYCLKEAAADSRFNLLSALLSMHLLLAGKQDGIDSIGYIAPYKAQARFMTALIQELIPNHADEQKDKRIVAATVHKFQGSERDMIVFDTVDSYPQHRAGVLLTDEDSDKLVNVAVTRARGKFIQLSDRKYMDTRVAKNKAITKLTAHWLTHNRSYTRHELPEVLQKSYDPKLQWFGEKDNGALLTDLAQARKIVISAPFPAKIETSVWQVLQKASGASITFVTQQKEQIPLKSFQWIAQNLVMPFILIDDEILWAGTPVMSHTHVDGAPEPPFIQCRLVSKKVVRLLYSYLNLEPAQQAAATEGQQRKLISLRPSFTLRQYVASWDQCPLCRSLRKVEMTRYGTILLICDYCGHKSGLTPRLLENYIAHIDLQCGTCQTPLTVTGRGKEIRVHCERCEEEIEVNSLW